MDCLVFHADLGFGLQATFIVKFTHFADGDFTTFSTDSTAIEVEFWSMLLCFSAWGLGVFAIVTLGGIQPFL